MEFLKEIEGIYRQWEDFNGKNKNRLAITWKVLAIDELIAVVSAEISMQIMDEIVCNFL